MDIFAIYPKLNQGLGGGKDWGSYYALHIIRGEWHVARVKGTWLHALWWSDRWLGVPPRDAGKFGLGFTVFVAFGVVLLVACLALQSV